MKQLIEITNNQPKELRLQYELGNLCNYACWYCFPGSNEGDKLFPDIEIVKYNLVKLINHYFESKKIDYIQLNFLGGEPTLWRDLGELVEYVSKNVNGFVTFSMQTNGSRTIRWWEQYGKYFDHVSISIHHERVDIDHVKTVANTLVKQGVSVLTAVLMDHTAWDKCVAMVNSLVKSKIKFMVMANPIQVNGITNYTKEQETYLEKSVKRRPSIFTVIRHLNKYSKIPVVKAIYDNGEKIRVRSNHYFLLNKLNRFTGWSCSVGINFLNIGHDGRISGACRQKVYGLNYYYNINDIDFIEKFNPTIQYVTCQQAECLCSGESIIHKKIIPISHST